MKKISEFFHKNKIKLYCLILSFAILLFTSKNSFLYPLNDWVDANAFFTMGKSMMNGAVPYRDVFEQKGLLLYFIYGLGYLMSPKTFHGVFIIEVLFFSTFLYYCHKIISMFLDKKFTYIILPILALIMTTSTSFVHGGSAEEFCFPFFAITLYYFFKHFKDKELNKKELYINGLMAGFVFMIKYSLIGFWFAFMLFIFIDFIYKKKIKDSFASCIFFLLGMFTPILISVIYFICTNSLKSFIDCYFITNLTSYNATEITIADKINTIYEGTVKTLLADNIYFFFDILSFVNTKFL